MASSKGSTVNRKPTKIALGDKEVFTTGEAAEICKVSQQTIIRCFDAGRLGGFRVPGSRFRRIPREALMKFMQHNEIPIQGYEPPGKKILVVDDDPAILELFTDLLGEDDRFRVKTASTGYDAGLITGEFDPDLIILDYMLPDLNGNVVCERIREDDSRRDTKIIIVSGVIDESEINNLLAAGADEFIKKPFHVKKLRERVEALLEI